MEKPVKKIFLFSPNNIKKEKEIGADKPTLS
jgi:hypothetical protein